MNQTAVANYVKTTLEGITGITGTVRGRPQSMPSHDGEYPFNYFEVGDPLGQQLTFAWRADAYDITITHVLGLPSMDPETAQIEKTKWADRYRAAFSGDNTLGGNCFDSLFREGTNNLDIYTETEENPTLTYKLLIVEHTLDSSAASE